MDCAKYITFVKNTIDDSPGMEPEKRNNLEKQLNKIIARSQDPYLNVALIGNFSSGKSTFINAMLGMNVLRVGWLATTVVPTRIYHSAGESIAVIAEDKDGEKYSLSNVSQRQKLEKKLNAEIPADLQECIDFLSTSNKNLEALKYIELYINSDRLDENMCIVDTPGVNPGATGTEEHVNMTRNVLREHADAAIVLFPASIVYTGSFSRFLTENALHFLDNAIFVVTMLDMVNENERAEITEFAKNRLREQFGLADPLVYGISAKRSMGEGISSEDAHWQKEFRQMQEEVYQYLQQRREEIITGQLTKLLGKLLEDLDAEVKDSTARINKDLDILEKNSVSVMKNEMQECLKNAESEFRYRQIEVKDTVLQEYSQNFDSTKSSIRSSINLCDEIYGNGRWSIPYYYNNGLKITLSVFQSKTEASVKKAAEELSLIVNQFFEKANSILHKYQLGLGEMSANTDETANGRLSEVSFDSAVTYGAYSSTTSAAQRTAEVATVLVAGVPALAVWAVGKIFDADFTYGFMDKFESKISKFGNMLATKFNAIEGARNRAYNTISGQLDAKDSTIKVNLNEQMTKMFDGLLADMREALPKYTEQYNELFIEKQREYDAKVSVAKESLRQNEIKSYDIRMHLGILKGELGESLLYTYCADIVDNSVCCIEIKPGKCIDIQYGSMEDGAVAHIWSEANVASQFFVFKRLTDGTYAIFNYHSLASLAVHEESEEDYAPIVQLRHHHFRSPNELDKSPDWTHWYIFDSGNGWYRFQNKHTMKYMDIQGGIDENGTLVRQCTDQGTDAQLFRVIPWKTEAVSASPETAASDSICEIEYIVRNNDASIVGITGETPIIAIPSNINGHIVTAVFRTAFMNNENISRVILPESVTAIGNLAFCGCVRLKSIAIPESVTVIDNLAFCGCISLETIAIPESVTAIGQYAFAGCKNLSDITIPESVATIENFAFYRCISLTSVTLPDNITAINACVFMECTNLKDIKIPEGVTSIGERAFYNCSNLNNVIVPNSVTDIGCMAFQQCTGLVSITIPDSVTTIDKGMFESCSSLTSVTAIITGNPEIIAEGAFAGRTELTNVIIPDSVTVIGDRAFEGCTGLTGLTLPEGVITIGRDAFKGCANLSDINIPDSVITVDKGAFDGCVRLKGVTIIPDGITKIDDQRFCFSSSLITVIIPNSVTAIGEKAFYDCKNLKSVFIPASVKMIGKEAFRGCEKLSSIRIPNGVTAINENTFFQCKNLTGIVIPDSVTTIGGGVFYECENLQNVDIPASVTTICEKTFYRCINLQSVSIPNSVTAIGETAFCGCKNLLSISLPNGVKTIGKGAFHGCDNLASITIPGSVTLSEGVFSWNSQLTNIVISYGVTEIGKQAFSHCEKLESIIIPDSVTMIGEEAFSSCKNLKSADIPDSVTTIGEKAFSHCVNLESIVLSNSVTTIAEGAFLGCNSLKTIIIPDSVTTIGNMTFIACTALSSIIIPDGVTTIGEEAFSSCENLKSVDIPDSVTTIGRKAFSFCKNLESVDIPDSVTTIGERAFLDCKKLESIVLPNSVTTIAEGAFSRCENLKSITIPNSVTMIGEEAFSYCKKLESIILPDGLKTIAKKIFEYCDNLTSVKIPNSVTTICSFSFWYCKNLTSVTLPDSVVNIETCAFNSHTSIKREGDILK